MAASNSGIVKLLNLQFQWLAQNPHHNTSDDQLASLLHALRSGFYAQGPPTNPEGGVDEAVWLGFLALQTAIDSALLEKLGSALENRYLERDDINDLTLSIQYFQITIKMTAPDHPDYTKRLDLLAEVFDLRHDVTGDEFDLSSAIQFARTAMIGKNSDDDSIGWRQYKLGEMLRSMSEKGDIAYLEEGIELLSKAAEATPEGAPIYTSRLFELAFKVQG